MIKSETNKMKKNCTGCKEVDPTCNCTIEVFRENEFDILILLDTVQGLKWCPESTVDSNFFKCSPDSFNRIKASQVIMINLTIKYHFRVAEVVQRHEGPSLKSLVSDENLKP